MNKLKIIGCALAVSLASTTALAGSDTGFYVGGSVGSAGTDVQLDTNNFDESATSYKVFGGYNFGLFPMIDVAVEGSYIDFGDPSKNINGTEVTAETTAWDVFGLVGFKMGPLGVFGKVGLVAWDTEFSALRDSFKDDRSDDGSDAAYGFGVKFGIASLAIRAEYEKFDMGEADVDMFSVGAAYTF